MKDNRKTTEKQQKNNGRNENGINRKRHRVMLHRSVLLERKHREGEAHRRKGVCGTDEYVARRWAEMGGNDVGLG